MKGNPCRSSAAVYVTCFSFHKTPSIHFALSANWNCVLSLYDAFLQCSEKFFHGALIEEPCAGVFDGILCFVRFSLTYDCGRWKKDLCTSL
jgi:hypothetical protein